MKMTSLVLLLIFMIIELSANENWIKIEEINKTKTPKSANNLDVNLSQIESINKMTKNVKVIKELLDATSKKDQASVNDKNWFILQTEDNK